MIAICLPCKDASLFLEETLSSILVASTAFVHGKVQLSIFNDGSKDESLNIIESWKSRFEEAGIEYIVSSSETPNGCGYAKNRAVEQCQAPFLCFQDADDIMLPERLNEQYVISQQNPNAIVGSQIQRIPESATPRYTSWLNEMTQEQLMSQRFKECTVAMPTWFLPRSIYTAVGGFDETGPGTPEDMIFFFKHTALGGTLLRVDKPLIIYRYHENAQSHSVHRDCIFALKTHALQEQLLSKLPSFSIWGGKEARQLFKQLTPENRSKVKVFLDVHPRKVGTDYIQGGYKIPVRYYTEATNPEFRPIITCVKAGLTGGFFEENLASLQLKEGRDYWPFE